MEMKMEEVGREMIKPASPSRHSRLHLSLVDLKASSGYVSAIFFYRAAASPEIISSELKSSLSGTLSRFYPLAGRREGVFISCNDEGAVFVEARTDLLLHDFLKNLDTSSLERLYPTMAPGEWPLLSVKLTFFGSGSGVAVSVSLSHGICDATSLLTFITDWATATGGSNNDTTIHFAETTIFPPPPPPPPPPPISLPTTPSTDILLPASKCVMNRFVLETSKIDELKRKAASAGVPAPTRVEAIMSLIWRCARNAWRSNLVVPRSTLMLQAADLRLRIPSTVLPPNTVGNLNTTFCLKSGVESDLEISQTVAQFRKAKETVNEMIKEHLQCDTLCQHLMSVVGDLISNLKPDVDLYVMTSWCRKPFYQVDFGWGSPLWVGTTTSNNTMPYVCLIDSKDSASIEAWISLPEQDMPILLRDQDFLAYAVLNPPVLI